MTYYYYKTSTLNTGQPRVSEDKINEWKHLADKKNWRITQLPNGFYQTEVNKHNDKEKRGDTRRRGTSDEDESAIDGSDGDRGGRMECRKGERERRTSE